MAVYAKPPVLSWLAAAVLPHLTSYLLALLLCTQKPPNAKEFVRKSPRNFPQLLYDVQKAKKETFQAKISYISCLYDIGIAKLYLRNGESNPGHLRIKALH